MNECKKLTSFSYATAPYSSSRVPRIRKSKKKIAGKNGKSGDLSTEHLSGSVTPPAPPLSTGLVRYTLTLKKLAIGDNDTE